jgi:hypothetical protein
MANILGSSDDVRIYSADGLTYTSLLAANFPQQISATPNGTFLVAGFSSANVTEFTETGTVVRTINTGSARGAYVLGNGNWLVGGANSTTGLGEYNPVTGTKVSSKGTGANWRYITKARVHPSLLPPTP